MTSYPSPQPFDRFVASLASATYDELRSLPGSNVESAAALEEMRGYLQDLYQGVSVVASFVDSDGQVVDCIPAEQHPSLKQLAGGPSSVSGPQVQPMPETYEVRPPSFMLRSTAELSDALPTTRGQEAAEAASKYPPGTIPMYRTTLEQLSRFRNLSAFHEKDRSEDIVAPTANPLLKRYATGEQDIACLGGGSYVNVWKVPATPLLQGTFSQQWYVAGHEGTLLQTVECGWHIDVARYGDFDPHLFVYTTRQTYDPGHSFFNLDGGVFQPVADPYVLPGAWLPSSDLDGVQEEVELGFFLTDGAWWFFVDGHAVGSYPLSWFNNGPLTTGATRIKFGGEVGSGLPSWPAMGSGRHASAGYGKAAYQRFAYVNPVSGGGVHANLSVAGSTTGSCYTIDITNNSATNWGTYLYFGGPGGQPC